MKHYEEVSCLSSSLSFSHCYCAKYLFFNSRPEVSFVLAADLQLPVLFVCSRIAHKRSELSSTPEREMSISCITHCIIFIASFSFPLNLVLLPERGHLWFEDFDQLNFSLSLSLSPSLFYLILSHYSTHSSIYILWYFSTSIDQLCINIDSPPLCSVFSQHLRKQNTKHLKPRVFFDISLSPFCYLSLSRCININKTVVIIIPFCPTFAAVFRWRLLRSHSVAGRKV